LLVVPRWCWWILAIEFICRLWNFGSLRFCLWKIAFWNMCSFESNFYWLCLIEKCELSIVWYGHVFALQIFDMKICICLWACFQHRVLFYVIFIWQNDNQKFWHLFLELFSVEIHYFGISARVKDHLVFVNKGYKNSKIWYPPKNLINLCFYS